MAERRQFKAIVVLPAGLTREQLDNLRQAFTTDLVATLGGADYLRDEGIAVAIEDEICNSVDLGPSTSA